MGILEAKNVTLVLGGKKVLDDLSIDFWEGHIHALVGPNGAGKSSLASVIMGLPGYTDIGGDVLLRWPATNNAGFVLFWSPPSPVTWLPVGGPYVLDGGFYEYREPLPTNGRLYGLRYVGLPSNPPQLCLHVDPSAALLAWGSAFAGFNLETTPAVPGFSNWQTVSGPYDLTNGAFQARTPWTAGSNAFFRLCKPLL